eukprot:6252413-Heterocapsa_arctica.AAC.1
MEASSAAPAATSLIDEVAGVAMEAYDEEEATTVLSQEIVMPLPGLPELHFMTSLLTNEFCDVRHGGGDLKQTAARRRRRPEMEEKPKLQLLS